MVVVAANFAPSLEKLRKSLKSQPLEASIEALISLLKRRQISGPQQCAVATAHILLQVVARGHWKNVDQLLDNIQNVGRRIASARPKELVIGNITKRVMGLIRDEAMEDRNADDDAKSTTTDPATASPAPPVLDATPRLLARQSTFTGSPHITAQSIFSSLMADSTDVSVGGSPLLKYSGMSTPTGGAIGFSNGASVANISSLRTEVINGIEEILDEISQVDDQIAMHGETYINPGDYVMVYKPTSTIERFLTRAARERQFTVLIAGTEDEEQQQTRKAGDAAAPPAAPYAALRKKLAAHNVPVINLIGQGVMAYFPLTTKVFLDARCVTSSGGVVADAGAGLLARAAREYNKAVFVLAGVYKVSPADLEDPEPVLEWADPSPQADYADGELLDGIEIRRPLVEYLGPEMITAYITNLGSSSRHNLQSVIRDHYKQDDIAVFIQ